MKLFIDFSKKIFKHKFTDIIDLDGKHFFQWGSPLYLKSYDMKQNEYESLKNEVEVLTERIIELRKVNNEK